MCTNAYSCMGCFNQPGLLSFYVGIVDWLGRGFLRPLHLSRTCIQFIMVVHYLSIHDHDVCLYCHCHLFHCTISLGGRCFNMLNVKSTCFFLSSKPPHNIN
jgi:hypothetical protein